MRARWWAFLLLTACGCGAPRIQTRQRPVEPEAIAAPHAPADGGEQTTAPRAGAASSDPESADEAGSNADAAPHAPAAGEQTTAPRAGAASSDPESADQAGSSADADASAGTDVFVSIRAAWGSGPSDVFAVGTGVLHFDGRAWTPMPIALGRAPLVAVWGSGPTNVFALTRDRIFRFDGQAWRPMEAPEHPGLTAVWGSGPDDVYFGGARGRVLRFDGRAFTALDAPFDHVFAITGSGPRDVLFTGDNGELATFDGTSWREHAPFTPERIVAAYTVSPSLAFVVTHLGSVYRYDGRRWRRERGLPTRRDGSDHACSVWAADRHHVLVGGEQSWVFVRDRRGWRRTHPIAPASTERFVVWGSSASDVYALGDGMSVFHLEAGQWTRVLGEPPDLVAE